jgi:hypothetical protein
MLVEISDIRKVYCRKGKNIENMELVMVVSHVKSY